MTKSAQDYDSDMGQLLNKYDSLEKRISLIEARIGSSGIIENGNQEIDEE